MIRSPKALLSAAILAAGFVAAPAMAQTAATGQSPQSAQTAPAVQPTDAQLQSFIKASKNISAVVQEYQPKVQAAPDEAAREQVIREADEKMVQLVRADGLSVEEFNGIGAAVEQNPQVRQRAMELAHQSGG